VVAALLIAVFGLTTWRHAGNYTDPERIWRSTLAVSNDVAMPHVNLGSLLANRAQTLEAKARREHDPAVRAEAGRLYKEAEDHYRQALRIKADDEDAHANLGVLLFRRGDITGALEHYYQALRIDPNYVGAHTRLANALLKLGRIDDALSHYRAAAGLQPNLAAAQRDLANALAVRGQWAQAVPYYRRALELAPEDVVSMHRLAWVLATASDAPVRNGPEAVALADRAVRLTRRRDPLALDALAAAYAETAQFQQAAGAAAEALDIARAQGSEALALQLARRLDGYRDGRPFRARPVPAEAGALVPPGAQR
jgi:tetratricopeptide (TPR) repeat protein